MSGSVREVEVRAFMRRYRQVDANCPVCDTTFTGSPLAVYCSDTCRQKAEWARRAEKVNEQRRQARRKKWEGQP